MPGIQWSMDSRVGDQASTAFMQQPIAPHKMSDPYVSTSDPSGHARRPSIAHTAPSTQIFQVAQPRPAIVDGMQLSSSSGVNGDSAFSARPGLQPRTLSAAGRKRSRDEFADYYDDSDLSAPSTKAHSPPKCDVDGDDGMAMADNDFNNGPVAEDLAARLNASSMAGRPLLESRKSIRLDPSTKDASEPQTFQNSMARPGTSYSCVSDPGSHDPATLVLGPSWSTMLTYDPKQPHIQSAIRGWTAYLESQYPLRSVKFEWQKKSEPSGYLVGAILSQNGSKWRGGTPGYFLFDDNLRRGRLVAKSWNNALDALRTGVFEGDDVMVARDHQYGYGLHGEGLNTDDAQLLQGQAVTYHDNGDITMDAVTNGGEQAGFAPHDVAGDMDLD